MTPKYILAKYVPDLGRMEPRNIGVFVWYKGTICSKFLNVQDADFIKDVETYERWKTFWARRIEGDMIRPSRGRAVSKSDPASLEALISTQKGNYILVDSGELLHSIKKAEIQKVTDYLFDDLVAIPGKYRTISNRSFRRQCEGLLQRAGMEYKIRKPVACTWNGVERHLHPDYYVGNGRADAIFQRANLKKEENVNSSAFIVDNLLNQGIVDRQNCRVLFRSSDIVTLIAEEGLRMFEKLCQTVDVESADAEAEISRVSATLTA